MRQLAQAMSNGEGALALRAYASCRWPYKVMWINQEQIQEMRVSALSKALPLGKQLGISSVADLLLCKRVEQPAMAEVHGLGAPSSWPADPLGVKVGLRAW